MARDGGIKPILALGLVGLLPAAAWADQALTNARETASANFDPLVIQRAWLPANLGFVALLLLLAWAFQRARVPRLVGAFIAAVGVVVVLAPLPVVSGGLSQVFVTRLPNVLETILIWMTVPRTFTSLAGAFLTWIGLAALLWPRSRAVKAAAANRSGQ